MTDGLFFAIEGGEGAGKSTQVALLAERLRAGRPGHQVIVTKEPGGTPIGERVRDLVLHTAMNPRTEAMLYLAARAEHVATVIRPALEQGHTVITDRFVDSNLVYQGVARQLGAHRIAEMSSWVTDGVRPDMVIVLDVDPVEGLARVADRGDANRFDQENLAFHHRVRAGFLDLARQMQDQARTDRAWNTRTPRYVVIDATRDTEVVAHDVYRAAVNFIVEGAVNAL